MTLAMCLQTQHWSQVESSEWWAARQKPVPRGPAFQALLALSRDALTGKPVTSSGLPESTSSSAFLEHLLAHWEHVHPQKNAPWCPPLQKGFAESLATPVSPPDATSTCDGMDANWPAWAATAPAGSPLGLLSLHALKLQCPFAISQLWSTFLGVIAVDHCEILERFNGPLAAISSKSLRADHQSSSISQEQVRAESTSPKGAFITDEAQDVRNHTLQFEVPYLVVALDELGACIDALALLDSESPGHVSHGLVAIAEEGSSSCSTDDWDLAGHCDVNLECTGDSTHLDCDGNVPDALHNASCREGSCQAMDAAGKTIQVNGPHNIAGEAFAARCQIGAAGGPEFGAGQFAGDLECSLCSANGLSNEKKESTFIDSAMPTADGLGMGGPMTDNLDGKDLGDGEQQSGAAVPLLQGQVGGGVAAVEARIRGAVESLRDTPPAHLLVILLFTSCQVCPHACRMGWHRSGCKVSRPLECSARAEFKLIQSPAGGGSLRDPALHKMHTLHHRQYRSHRSMCNLCSHSSITAAHGRRVQSGTHDCRSYIMQCIFKPAA
jgi:hypothetical protein